MVKSDNPPPSAMMLNVSALLDPACFPHPVKYCRLIETHISWVILTGDYAYKIKKPLDLGFLDFSSLEKRCFYCHEECRLNKYLAPDIYLDVLPITGSEKAPVIAGTGKTIDYAIKMHEFPQAAQLDKIFSAGKLTQNHITAFAGLVARFHQQTKMAEADSPYGLPASIQSPVKENFFQIQQYIQTPEWLQTLEALSRWESQQFQNLKPYFLQRKQQGFIRECHGDMHLRNLAWLNDTPVIFDCIEFNPELRWIDTINDAAFLIMDLQARQQTEFAIHFLNQYLEQSGDYPALALLNYYLVYRALVRAKVAAIRLSQETVTEATAKKDLNSTTHPTEAKAEFICYLSLAQDYTQAQTPRLILMCGVSATGKSTVSQTLLAPFNAIRLRSDVERKRLYGLKPTTSAASQPQHGIYSKEATHRTYQKLYSLATHILDAGFSVIVDATFSERIYRHQFLQLAENKQLPFSIIKLTANPETLRQRIIHRKQDVSDASLSVLESQLQHWQALDSQESSHSIELNTEEPLDVSLLLQQLHRQPHTPSAASQTPL